MRCLLALAVALPLLPAPKTVVSIKGDQFYINGKPTYQGRTWNGHKIEGRMIEASDTNLSLSRSSKVVNIARADIQEIFHSKGKAAKGKWAAIGTAAGAGTGAGLGAIKYDSSKDDYEIYPVMGFLIGAGVGAAVGTVFGASRRSRTLIYTAP